MVIPYPRVGTHALLTRAPLSTGPKPCFTFDLHVLGLPPAFVLSQDQTLKLTSPDADPPEGGSTPGFQRELTRSHLHIWPLCLATQRMHMRTCPPDWHTAACASLPCINDFKERATTRRGPKSPVRVNETPYIGSCTGRVKLFSRDFRRFPPSIRMPGPAPFRRAAATGRILRYALISAEIGFTSTARLRNLPTNLTMC